MKKNWRLKESQLLTKKLYSRRGILPTLWIGDETMICIECNEPTGNGDLICPECLQEISGYDNEDFDDDSTDSD